MTLYRRSVLIESLGRGRNFRKMNDARAFLLSLTSPFPLSKQRDAAQRDVMLSRLHTKREKTVHTHERSVGRATYFCRTPSRSPLANSVPPLRSHTSFPPPGSSRLRTILYPRGGQPLLFIPYPLFFILYIPVCLGRQTRVPRMA